MLEYFHSFSSRLSMNLLSRIKQSSRELILFATAALALGMAFSMVDATFNNFLNDKFALTGFQRSFLEFPRELPGFLVVFVSAALWFLCSRRLSVTAMIFAVVGAVMIGFASSSYGVMGKFLDRVVWKAEVLTSPKKFPENKPSKIGPIWFQ